MGNLICDMIYQVHHTRGLLLNVTKCSWKQTLKKKHQNWHILYVIYTEIKIFAQSRNVYKKNMLQNTFKQPGQR